MWIVSVELNRVTREPIGRIRDAICLKAIGEMAVGRSLRCVKVLPEVSKCLGVDKTMTPPFKQ